MFKMIAFVMFFLPNVLGIEPTTESATCTCATVANLQKTAHAATSISYSWNATSGATQYKLWYYLEEDDRTSGYFYTGNTSFSFTDLEPGHYTFYFVADCNGDMSELNGTEDLIMD